MQYRKGYNYQLAGRVRLQTNLRPEQEATTQFINLTTEGVLTISAGYEWDGPSGPTMNTDNSMTPSLIHDAVYQLMRQCLLDASWRDEADKQLYLMLRKRGMSWVRAKYWLRGVQWFAEGAATPGDTKEVFEAP